MKKQNKYSNLFGLRIYSDGLYYVTFGREFKVTSVFSSPDGRKNLDSVNNFLSTTGKGDGVIFSTKDDTLIITASNEDRGRVWIPNRR